MSNQTKLSEIRSAVSDLVYRLNGTGGVTTVIPANHIYAASSQSVGKTTDSLYPKVVLAFDGGKSAPRVGKAVGKSVTLDVIFSFKKTATHTQSAVDQTESCLEDMEKLIADDNTLGGLVTQTVMSEWSSDSGFADPEGILICRLQIDYEFRY